MTKRIRVIFGVFSMIAIMIVVMLTPSWFPSVPVYRGEAP